MKTKTKKSSDTKEKKSSTFLKGMDDVSFLEKVVGSQRHRIYLLTLPEIERRIGCMPFLFSKGERFSFEEKKERWLRLHHCLLRFEETLKRAYSAFLAELGEIYPGFSFDLPAHLKRKPGQIAFEDEPKYYSME